MTYEHSVEATGDIICGDGVPMGQDAGKVMKEHGVVVFGFMYVCMYVNGE